MKKFLVDSLCWAAIILICWASTATAGGCNNAGVLRQRQRVRFVQRQVDYVPVQRQVDYVPVQRQVDYVAAPQVIVRERVVERQRGGGTNIQFGLFNRNR
jgi:hypothetical protein